MVAAGLGGSDPPTQAILSPVNPSVRRTAAPRFGCGWARKFERWMGCQRLLSGGGLPSAACSARSASPPPADEADSGRKSLRLYHPSRLIRRLVRAMFQIGIYRLLLSAAFFCFSLTLAHVRDAAAETPAENRFRLVPILSQKQSEVRIGTNSHAEGLLRIFVNTDIRSSAYGTEMCVVELPAKSFYVQVTEIMQEGSPSQVFRTIAPKRAVGILNGGFFGLDRAGRLVPLGFVKIAGIRKSKLHPWRSGGVLTVTARGTQIVPIRRFVDNPSIRYALQSKLLLVENGQRGIRGTEDVRSDRSAIALTNDGKLLMVVIHEPSGFAASLAEFSTLLVSFRTKSDGQVTWAMNMDGGPGAHLYVPGLDRHCGADIRNYLPNAIVVSE